MELGTNVYVVGAAVITIGVVGFLFSSKRKKQEEDSWESHVLPHGEIQELTEGLWMVRGTLKHGPPRNMTIYRLPDGKLLIHSCIALNEAGMKQLETLGEPKLLIVPNKFHRADPGVWKRRFPGIIVLCPASAKESVEEVVRVDDVCENVLPKYNVHCLVPQGLKEPPAELVYEVPLKTGVALIMCDLLFNLGPEDKNLISAILGSTGDGTHPFVSRLFKWLAVKDKQVLAQWLRTCAEDRVKFIVVAHGNSVKSRCADMLRHAADSM